MDSFKNTRTEEAILSAYAGECMAYMKYMFFAEKAKEDGYEQIAAIFEETARNEKAHAEIWFKLFNGGIGSTEENLLAAARGENEETTTMYKNFERIAKSEGFEKIEELFREIGTIESQHEERYLKLLDNIRNDKVFNRPGEQRIWICRNCGHIVIGEKPDDVCDVCEHSKGFVELKAENY